MTKVLFSKFAEKQVAKVPIYVAESLKGHRLGQRSIRLNRSYRAIYIENADGLEILIIEVNKHEY